MNTMLGVQMSSLLLTGGVTQFSDLKGWKWLLGQLFSFVLNSDIGQDLVVQQLCIVEDDLSMSFRLWDMFGVFALGLAIIGFLFDIDRQIFMMQQNFTMKDFFFPFVKLAACMLFLQYGKPLVKTTLNLNNYLVNQAAALDFMYDAGADPGSKISPAETAAAQAIDDMNLILAALVVAPLLLMMFILQIVPMLVMYYNAVVRKLEIILRVGFSPIAMADVYKMADSTMWRWLKKLLALGLYGVGIVMIMKIGKALQVVYLAKTFGEISTASGMADNPMGAFLGLVTPVLFAVVILFAELGACSMIKQATNEVLGV